VYLQFVDRLLLLCLICHQLPYAGDTRGRGRLIVNEDAAVAAAAAADDDDAKSTNNNNNRRQSLKKTQTAVPCFPLDTILAALNRSRVDYFSLDIEGFELPVLKTVDWKRVDIRVLSVEFTRGKVRNTIAAATTTTTTTTTTTIRTMAKYSRRNILSALEIFLVIATCM